MNRQKSSVLKGFALLVLGLSLGACEDPSTKVDAAKVEAAKKVKPTEKKLSGTRIDFDQAHGAIGFTGSKVTGKHDGGFKTFKGTLDLVEDKPEKSSFTVTIDMSSTFSDSDKLTGHLMSADFFETAVHKESVFESTSIVKEGEKYQVSGNLTLHGVTKSIKFPSTIVVSEDTVNLSSEFSINRKDFGIAYKGRADDLIRDGVVLRLNFEIKR